MKKLSILAALMFVAVTATCAPAQKNDDKTSANKPASTKTTDMPAGKLVEIDQQQFNQLIADINNPEWAFKGQRPAIVDFNATWCGPCRQMAPILEELAKEYRGKVDFYSIDIDKNKELAMALGIQSIPFLIICPMTGDPAAVVGLQPKEELQKAIQGILEQK